MADYGDFWRAIHEGGDWSEVLEGIKALYRGDKRKISNLNRQKNRIRAYFENRSVQKRSGKYTEWIHEVVAQRISYYGGYDLEEVVMHIGKDIPSGYELRGNLLSLKEVAEYIKVIPLEYLFIVPTSRGWAIYVMS